MDIIELPHDVKARLRPLQHKGLRIGFVPTMGALHDGHLSLIDEANQRADVVVASIFVNPKQFGPSEDLDRYPRDLESDAKKLEARGCRVVFTPTPAAMYPDGFQTAVTVERTTKGLCGASRSGHFDGVTTVVLALFEIVRPDVAVFGQKDYQQLAVIRAMAKDLHLDVEIVGAPIVREADGLAMSSRNVFLSAGERTQALSLSRALVAAKDARSAGEADPDRLVEIARRVMLAADVEPEYLELRDAETLDPVTTAERPVVLLVAAPIGRTRLIDNQRLEP